MLHIDHLTEASIIADNIKSFPPGNGITILEFPDVVTSEIDRDFIDCYRVLGHWDTLEFASAKIVKSVN